MEQALLQAERRAEQEQVETENEIISQLQHKLSQLDKAIQKEKEKVGTQDANNVTLKLLSVFDVWSCTVLHVNVGLILCRLCFSRYKLTPSPNVQEI